MNEDDLRQVFFAMRPHNENSAHGAWANHGNSLRHHVLNETTDHFLRWSTMIATMVVGSTPFIEAEYELLPASIKEAIVDSRFGDPLMLMGDQTSASYSHQAFHLYQWSAMTGKTMREIKSIVEFGGGYGAMCLICRETRLEDIGKNSARRCNGRKTVSTVLRHSKKNFDISAG